MIALDGGQCLLASVQGKIVTWVENDLGGKLEEVEGIRARQLARCVLPLDHRADGRSRKREYDRDGCRDGNNATI